MAINPVIQRVEGLKELEANLKILREQFDVKTGGVIIRGLLKGAQRIRDAAKLKAPDKDPRGFLKAREARLALEAQRKQGRKGVRGRGTLNPTLALIRHNIVAHPIKVSDPRADGRPTVLVRVRNSGYLRFMGKIYFKRPTTSPGWWWWVEFGTSRMAARPFLRPAFEGQKEFAVQIMKNTIRAEIETLFTKFGKTVRRAA